MPLTLRQLGAAASPRVTFHENMSAQQLSDSFDKLPAAIKALVPPEITASVMALRTALSYSETKDQIYAAAKQARQVVQKVITTASGILTGNPIATQQAQEDSSKSMMASAVAAIKPAVDSAKTMILDTPIPGT